MVVSTADAPKSKSPEGEPRTRREKNNDRLTVARGRKLMTKAEKRNHARWS